MDLELNINKNMEYENEDCCLLKTKVSYIPFSLFLNSLEETETIQLNEDIVNLGVKLGPQDFELKKVLGKGGYGKVFQVRIAKLQTHVISSARPIIYIFKMHFRWKR